MASKSQLITVEETWPRLEAAAWTAGLVVLFLVTYFTAAWITTKRSFVPSVAFGWEHRIPFLPWTIVPYWSADLFFLCAPFLFRTRPALRTYGKRIVAVQILSIGIFLLFPLQFSFGRPHLTGLLEVMFAIRTGIDTQFNEAPSLHIGFTVVLWLAYRKHMQGWRWRITQVGFVAMSLATLTTYRHHFIDLPTGMWAGLFCAALFPEQGSKETSTSRLVWMYVAGAVLFSFASYWAGTMRWLIVWPVGLAVILSERILRTKLPETRAA